MEGGFRLWNVFVADVRATFVVERRPLMPAMLCVRGPRRIGILVCHDYVASVVDRVLARGWGLSPALNWPLSAGWNTGRNTG